MQRVSGWWYPDGDTITKSLRARLETEAVYRGDRLEDALKHVTHWHTAVDVGAHIGCWTRELAKRFKRVIAIEPNPEAAACVRENCRGHGNVEVIEMAAGPDTGEKTCYVALRRNKGSISSMIAHPGAHPGDNDGVVPIRSIDSLVVRDVDYMKVHCNGYELPALRGAQHTIDSSRPVITVVIKPAAREYAIQPEDFHEFMGSIGYRVVSRLKPYFVFAPC